MNPKGFAMKAACFLALSLPLRLYLYRLDGGVVRGGELLPQDVAELSQTDPSLLLAYTASPSVLITLGGMICQCFP